MNLMKKIQDTTNCIKEKTNFKPEIGIILGSGLGSLAEEIQNPINISYSSIPHFPQSTVQGHKGQLVLGVLEGKNVIAMQGRFHYYEGYSIQEIIFPVRVMKALGVKILIVTNAAGGVNREYEPGDLMIIKDHINFAFDNPLIGKNYEQLGPRFPDMSSAYIESLINIAHKSAKEIGVSLKEGTYMWMTGPTYETPAEVKMALYLGADAVGMSTVPEVIVARHSNINVLGISCITNMASGILDQPLNHDEVIENSTKVKQKFITLIKKILENV